MYDYGQKRSHETMAIVSDKALLLINLKVSSLIKIYPGHGIKDG